MSRLSDDEREVVNTLLQSRAVNFEAVASTLAKFGPSAVLNLDYEDVFLRHHARLCSRVPSFGSPSERT